MIKFFNKRIRNEKILKNTLRGRCTWFSSVSTTENHSRTTQYIWLAPAVARPILASVPLRQTSDILKHCDEIHSFRSALLRFIRNSVAMVCGSLWVARCTTSFRSASFRGHRATHGYTKYFAPKFFKFCLKILRIAADHCQTYFFWIFIRICIFHHQFRGKSSE